MTMNRELFLSILAMDSYNRGYGTNIDNLGESGKIGNADIREFRAGEQKDWIAAGFYAIAYEVPAGYVEGLTGTVISYRGTNYDKTAGHARARDIFTGWLVGAGLIGGPLGAASQAGLTLDFYKAVNKGVSAFDLTGSIGTITTTGHSLGGGLAGFVSTLSGVEGVGFAHMPFGAGAIADAMAFLAKLKAANDNVGGERLAA